MAFDTAIAAEDFCYILWIRLKTDYLDRQLPTHKKHCSQISEWQHSHVKRTVNFSDPPSTNRQKEQFKLDPQSKDIVFIHAV